MSHKTQKVKGHSHIPQSFLLCSKIESLIETSGEYSVKPIDPVPLYSLSLCCLPIRVALEYEDLDSSPAMEDKVLYYMAVCIFMSNYIMFVTGHSGGNS